MVSVIVPNYNSAPFLRKRLDSILNQTYTNYECILLDDASIDHSIDILQEYVSRDSRFRLYINKVNSGSTFAQWNYGISLSKGKFIWIAESDDYAEPDFLYTLITEFNKDSTIVLAYSNSTLIDSSEKVIGDWKYHSTLFNTPFTQNGLKFIQNHLLFTNVIPNASAVLFLRETYNTVGQAIPDLKINGDWHLWLKILTIGKVYFTSSTLNKFRQHQKSVTFIAKDNLKKLDYFDFQILRLRNQYQQYLNLYNSSFQDIIEKNMLYISYEWGNYGIYLKQRGMYFTSLLFILKASFFPRFKSYYLKKYIFGDFYNNLFKK